MQVWRCNCSSACHSGSDPTITYKVPYYKIVTAISPCESTDGKFPAITGQPVYPNGWATSSMGDFAVKL